MRVFKYRFIDRVGGSAPTVEDFTCWSLVPTPVTKLPRGIFTHDDISKAAITAVQNGDYTSAGCLVRILADFCMTYGLCEIEAADV
jgi:hypothetical protein